jgi:hypothetical protein
MDEMMFTIFMLKRDVLTHVNNRKDLANFIKAAQIPMRAVQVKMENMYGYMSYPLVHFDSKKYSPYPHFTYEYSRCKKPLPMTVKLPEMMFHLIQGHRIRSQYGFLPLYHSLVPHSPIYIMGLVDNLFVCFRRLTGGMRDQTTGKHYKWDTLKRHCLLFTGYATIVQHHSIPSYYDDWGAKKPDSIWIVKEFMLKGVNII